LEKQKHKINKYYSLAILLIFSIFFISLASASTGSYNWNFSTASDYAYTPSEIIVSGGSAYLNGTTSAPLYSWWHLNENTGTSVGDSSGNSRNGTMLGTPLWVAGKLDRALQFNGLTNYVDFGNTTANFERTTAFSVELWLKTSNTGQQILLSKMKSSGNYEGWEIYYEGTSTNNIVFDLSSVASTNMIRAYCTPSSVADNNWHHIVVTYDGSSNITGVKFYFDGVLKTTGTTFNSLTGSILTSTPFQLSGRGNGAIGVVGVLDEVVIYSGILSAEKVTSRYNSGAGTESAVGDYQTGYYTINPKINLSFGSKLLAFTETATLTGSAIQYIISNDSGSTWKYWGGSSWLTSNQSWSQSNPSSTINTNINTLASSGTFTFKAFLHSNDGTYSPYLDNIYTLYDSDAPIISSVSATPSFTSAIVTWTTNENSNSSVNYGTGIEQSATLVTSHSVTLTGLTPSTFYSYNVTSCDTYGNCGTSTDYNFTTSIASAPVISGVSASPTATTSTITWNTDTLANSTACWWISGSPSCLSNSSDTLSHSILATGLTENTWYNYYVKSCNVYYCTQSSNSTFHTTFSYSNGSTIDSVYSKDGLIWTQDDPFNLTAICYTSSGFCNGLTTCRLTIVSPNSNVLINNQLMNWQTTFYTYQIDDTSVTGEYTGTIMCNGINSEFLNFNFQVTPTGEIPSTAKGILYAGILLILVVLFIIALYGGSQTESIVIKSACWLGAYLMMIGVSFIAWGLTRDYLTTASFLGGFFRIVFLVLMYALFPLILILTFYTLWMMRKIDVIQRMIDDGVPIDEAYERTVKGGGKRNW